MFTLKIDILGFFSPALGYRIFSTVGYNDISSNIKKVETDDWSSCQKAIFSLSGDHRYASKDPNSSS